MPQEKKSYFFAIMLPTLLKFSFQIHLEEWLYVWFTETVNDNFGSIVVAT